MIEEIFKVPLYRTKLDLNVIDLQSWCKQHQQKDNGRKISNIGGYQSNNLLKNDVSLQPLIKEIENHSTVFANQIIPLWPKRKQAVANMWVNINGYLNWNKPHLHGGCRLSGVYYVKTPPNCGTLQFEHPAINLLELYSIGYAPCRLDTLNKYNSPIWSKSVSENQLYLFPSWLLHSVYPNENKTEERISISFNTVSDHPSMDGRPEWLKKD